VMHLLCGKINKKEAMERGAPLLWTGGVLLEVRTLGLGFSIASRSASDCCSMEIELIYAKYNISEYCLC